LEGDKNVFSGTSEGNMLLQWIRGRQIGIEKLIKMLIFNHFLFAFAFEASQTLSSAYFEEAERMSRQFFFSMKLMSFA